MKKNGKRRCHTTAVTESKKFLKMPDSAQNLYFHAMNNTDDFGVVDLFHVRQIAGKSENDTKILIENELLKWVDEEEEIALVWHFFEANKLNLRTDRINISKYKNEVEALYPDYYENFKNKFCQTKKDKLSDKNTNFVSELSDKNTENTTKLHTNCQPTVSENEHFVRPITNNFKLLNNSSNRKRIYRREQILKVKNYKCSKIINFADLKKSIFAATVAVFQENGIGKSFAESIVNRHGAKKARAYLAYSLSVVQSKIDNGEEIKNQTALLAQLLRDECWNERTLHLKPQTAPTLKRIDHEENNRRLWQKYGGI